MDFGSAYRQMNSVWLKDSSPRFSGTDGAPDNRFQNPGLLTTSSDCLIPSWLGEKGILDTLALSRDEARGFDLLFDLDNPLGRGGGGMRSPESERGKAGGRLDEDL